MDAILNDGNIISINLDELMDKEIEEEYSQHVSLWIQEKDIIRASTNITVSTKLEPGVYTVDFNRDLGYYCSKLNYQSDDLFIFSDSIAEDLLNEIKLFWDKKELYQLNKLIHKRGILLEGYSGTGKSSMVTQLSEEVIKQGGIVFKVQSPSNLDVYIDFIRLGFRRIQPDTPFITIIEDIDQYEGVEADLLDFLDGKTSFNHHVVIATTNNTEIIPDTLLRSSRFDLKIEVPLPNEQTRAEYFRFKNVSEDVIPDLVKATKDCSLADLKEIYVCIFLLEYSIEEALSQVNAPRTKINYLSRSNKASKIGL